MYTVLCSAKFPPILLIVKCEKWDEHTTNSSKIHSMHGDICWNLNGKSDHNKNGYAKNKCIYENDQRECAAYNIEAKKMTKQKQ